MGGLSRGVGAKEFLAAVEAAGLPLSDRQRKTIAYGVTGDGGYHRYLLVPAGTEMPVQDGRSYFGSGCYGGSFHAAGNIKTELTDWDNRFASGTSGTVTLMSGSIVSCVAGDALGNPWRDFQNYIAACLPEPT